MEFMLNSEHVETVKKYLALYPIDGVTTNPMMIAREGKTNFFNLIKDLRNAVGTKKLFVQVISPVYEEMLAEAELIRNAGGENMYIKIPATETGIRATRTLSERGYNILVTVVLSPYQGVLALHAGAKYIAVFYDNMFKAGIDGDATFRQIAAYIKESGCKGKILAAGVRDHAQFGKVIENGAQAITADANFYSNQMVSVPTQEYLDQFKNAWDGAYGKDIKIIDFNASGCTE